MPQRWTAKKKAEVVIEIIKGKLKVVDFCRQNDLKQSEVETWMDEFIKSGTMGLKTNPKQAKDEYGRKENHVFYLTDNKITDYQRVGQCSEIEDPQLRPKK